MKICHITSVHPIEDGRIFRRECISLAKAGFDVYLVQQGSSYCKEGVNIIGYGKQSRSRFRRIIIDAKTAYDVALEIDADAYHLHDPELLPYALRLKKRGKIVIFDSHEMYRLQIRNKPYLPKYFAYLLSSFYGLYENYVLNHIDAIIIPCLINGEKWFHTKCPNQVVSNNVPWLAEVIDDNEKEYSVNSGVCMIGTLTKSRGVLEIVRAANLANIECKLVGSISDDLYNEVKDEDKKGIIKYYGVVSHQDAIGIIKNTSVGLATLLNIGQYNKADNLPTKVYEYMGSGIPVILTNASYNKKMVEKYKFGICVDPKNINDFASAIKRLIDNPDLAREMGSNGKKAVIERFNWEYEQKTLIELYNNLFEEVYR